MNHKQNERLLLLLALFFVIVFEGGALGVEKITLSRKFPSK